MATLQVSCAIYKPPIPHKFDNAKSSLSSSGKQVLRDFPQIPSVSKAPKSIKETSLKLLDAFVDHVFEFVDQPYLPSQSNFVPVEEIGEAVEVSSNIQGTIPHDFPEGVYLRNGSNPSHGGLKSAVSIFGKTSHIWVEGEGMIHALYFNKNTTNINNDGRRGGGGDGGGGWIIRYNNKYVKTDTFKMEKEMNKPAFLPVIEGSPAAVVSSFLLNLVRFGKANKNLCNTNIFEHSGKYYSISENDKPQEIDIHTLETLGTWNCLASWNRPFTSHPKKAPKTGELVTIGSDGQKPYLVLGCISADGEKLIHNTDLKFDRSIICHELGITQRYNIILDFPILADLNRLLLGGSLLKYEKEKYARIGVMPRYGEADSLVWFEVEPCCAFHIINCYEDDDDEVVVIACRAEDSIIPGPEHGENKHDWFSRGFKHINSVKENSDDEGFLFARTFMWRLNMKTGLVVEERYLSGVEYALDFPMINDKFIGLKNKYGYAQVVDSTASSVAGLVKYNGLAKLFLGDTNLKFSGEKKIGEELIKVEWHMFPENTFCTGSAFIPKNIGDDFQEDDGWIITFVHNEATNISQAYIIDAKKFSSEPVAKITIPYRVPYGFHGAFMPFNN